MLDGSLAGPDASGLVIDAPNVTIRGLAIGNFQGAGIVLNAGGHDTILGDFLGTDASGLSPAPNRYGLLIPTSNNTVGGTNPGDRHLI
jgi:hypothetical protein